MLRNGKALLLQLSGCLPQCQEHQQLWKLSMHIYVLQQQKGRERTLQEVHFQLAGSAPSPASLLREVPLK